MHRETQYDVRMWMDDKDSSLFEKGRQGLLYALSDAPEPVIRRYSAFLVGERKDPADIPELIRALSDEDKEVRSQATRALSRFGADAIEPLSQACSSGSWKVRYRAAEALGLIGMTGGVPVLMVLVKDEKDHVRYMAARSLGRIGDDRGRDAVRPLISDENEYVRRAARETLGTSYDAV